LGSYLFTHVTHPEQGRFPTCPYGYEMVRP